MNTPEMELTPNFIAALLITCGVVIGVVAAAKWAARTITLILIWARAWKFAFEIYGDRPEDQDRRISFVRRHASNAAAKRQVRS